MRTHHHTKHRSLGTDLLLGGLAGAAATRGMGQVTGYLYEQEDPAARKREDAARGVAGHLAFGLLLDSALRLGDRVA